MANLIFYNVVVGKFGENFEDDVIKAFEEKPSTCELYELKLINSEYVARAKTKLRNARTSTNNRSRKRAKPRIRRVR